MKTGIRSSKTTPKVPPFSALLLILAALFAIAAWRVMEINQNQIPHDPPIDAVSKEVGAASDRSGVRAVYHAHRHHAISLGGSSAAERGRSSAPRANYAVL